MPLSSVGFIPPNSIFESLPDEEGYAIEGNSIPSFIDSSPIVIDGDADFAGQGFDGSGTIDAPFIIDSLNITTDSTCIEIKNTRSYFNVTNCLFTSITKEVGHGLVFNNVSNAYVDGNTFEDLSASVKWIDVNNSILDSCEIATPGIESVSLDGCRNVTILSNTINAGGADARGVHLYYSTLCNITGNSISCAHFGIQSEYSDNCTINLNTISDIGYHSHGNMYPPAGIYLTSSSDLIIQENSVYESPIAGVYFSNTDAIACIGNDFSGCGFFPEPGTTGFSSSGDLINGKPLYHAFNGSNLNIDGSQYGQIILHETDFSTVTGGKLNAASIGTYLTACTNITLRDATISKNGFAGAFLFQSNNCTLYNLTIEENSGIYDPASLSAGIVLSMSENASIVNSTIRDCPNAGIMHLSSHETEISGNFLEGNGIVFRNMGGLSEYCINEKNNLINGRLLGYFWNEENLDIDSSEYGQLIVVNSSGLSFSGGNFSKVSVGASFVSSPNCSIEDVNLNDNSLAGMQILSSSGLYVANATVENNLFHNIMNSESESLTVINSSIRSNGAAIPRNVGIPSLELCSDSLFSGSQFIRNHDGIYASGKNITVTTSEIANNELDGLRFENSDYCNISYNIISGNGYGYEYSIGPSGLFLSSSSNSTIHNNTIFGNYRCGIAAYATENEIYYNKIGWNHQQNALDEGEANLWDDNVSKGNAWSDYGGSGSYSIDTSGIDRWPNLLVDTTTPAIEGPSDKILEAGTIGNYLGWNGTDNYPHHYIIRRNGTILANESWFDTISYELEILPVGIYNFSITLFDCALHSVTDTVYVEIEDTTNPEWLESPVNQQIEYGEQFSYQLEASDFSGVDFFINDTVNFGLIEHNATISAMDLPVGEYGIRVTASDPFGNSIYADFKVNVEDTVKPTWDEEPENQVIESGDSFRYDINATDLAGVSSFSVNNTDFAIDDNGVITNDTWLDLGKHNLEVRAYDSSSNFIAAVFTVTVDDTLAPQIESPPDLQYTTGETGNTISWQGEDYNPASYQILIDGVEHIGGSWNESSEIITINVDSLDIGQYNYTIILTDEGGNSGSDEVLVIVNEETTTTITTTSTTETTPSTTLPPNGSNMSIILLTVGTIGAAFIIIIISYVKKANRP